MLRPENSPATSITALLRIQTVLQLTGESRTSHYRKIQADLFTKPIHIGANSSAWPANEVDAINKARIAGKTDDEIKALVAKLHAARGAA